MRIFYDPKKFGLDFEDFKECKKRRGLKGAKKIHRRLTQLWAVPSLNDLIISRLGRCHPLQGKRKDEFAIDLVHPQRMVFRPWGSSEEYIEKGVINTKKVVSVEIISIEAFH